jgi:23S rRNA (pseudouridine1915-N3)-methyltransferase
VTDLALCWPGKTSAAYARTGVDEYLGRIRRYRDCQVITTPEERHGSQYSDAHRVEREGAAILKRLDGLGPVWLCALDPGGKAFDTAGFAKLLRRQLYDDTRLPVFVVGGPDGLSSAVRQRADRLMGISSLTLPHDMARLVLVEQIYRALTIISGHPYDR